MTGHTNRGRDGYICGAAKYRRGLGCGPRVFVEKELLEDAVWDTVQVWTDAVMADDCQKVSAEVNEQLAAEWKAAGGADAAAAQGRLRSIDGKIRNLRAALEEGSTDVGWVNARLAELAKERAEALAAQGAAAVPSERPQVNADAVAGYLAGFRKLLPQADDQERRTMLWLLVEGVSLDPDEREVEIRVKLPANAVQRMEAAARSAVTGTVLAQYARVRLQCVRESRRRPASVVEVAGQ
jgi:hypothetical protein